MHIKIMPKCLILRIVPNCFISATRTYFFHIKTKDYTVPFSLHTCIWVQRCVSKINVEPTKSC